MNLEDGCGLRENSKETKALGSAALSCQLFTMPSSKGKKKMAAEEY
jgi:hypothetical protein